jgi:hypothetical protein
MITLQSFYFRSWNTSLHASWPLEFLSRNCCYSDGFVFVKWVGTFSCNFEYPLYFCHFNYNMMWKGSFLVMSTWDSDLESCSFSRFGKFPSSHYISFYGFSPFLGSIVIWSYYLEVWSLNWDLQVWYVLLIIQFYSLLPECDNSSTLCSSSNSLYSAWSIPLVRLSTELSVWLTEGLFPELSGWFFSRTCPYWIAL